MTDENSTWLPNLVGGVSIWKLAVDLNEEQFFDGRLLVPETEGSDSLPVNVRWNLTGLLPLAEARTGFPDDSARAIKDFFACLEKVAATFSAETSGYNKYKEAFTVPSLEADGGAHYFYDPDKKKLFVINWGASPRSIVGSREFIFGYENFGKLFEKEAALAPAAGSKAAAGALAAGAVAAGAAAVTAEAAKGDKDEEKKDDEEKKEEGEKKPRPWWIWLLVAVGFGLIVLLILWLLDSCEADKRLHNSADGAADPNALLEGGLGKALKDAEDDADAGTDAGDAASDADADASKDAGKDGSKDASKDGATASEDDDEDDGDDGTAGGGGGGGGGGGHPVVVTLGPGGGAKTGAHRTDRRSGAVAWRIVSGNEKVSRTESTGKKFDIYLTPGKTFEGVRTEWKDKNGQWHAQ